MHTHLKNTDLYTAKILFFQLTEIFDGYSDSFFFLSFFRAAPTAYGGSQARGPIRAVSASLRHSHSDARSELCLRPTPQLTVTPDP